MYCVHLYGLHVYCALVDLDSSGSPGVRPTSGLTSSTQVVCVCVRAYTSTHPPTTLTPVKIEKYTRQTPYLYPCQNITSHENNKRWAWKPPNYNPLLHTHAGVKQTLVIHMHVVERLDSTNVQKCVYTSAYVHPHACVHTCIWIHMHRHTYMHDSYINRLSSNPQNAQSGWTLDPEKLNQSTKFGVSLAWGLPGTKILGGIDPGTLLHSWFKINP